LVAEVQTIPLDGNFPIYFKLAFNGDGNACIEIENETFCIYATVASFPAALPGLAILINANNSTGITANFIAPDQLEIIGNGGTLDFNLNPEGNTQTWQLLADASNAVQVHLAWEAYLNSGTFTSGSKEDTSHAFFPICNPAFYKGGNEQYSEYINYFDNGGFAFNIALDNGDSTKYSIVPFVYVHHTIDKIEALCNVDLCGFFDRPEIRCLVIYNNTALDNVVQLPGIPDDFAFNSWQLYYDLADHVPDISVAAYLEAFRTSFGLAFIADPCSNKISVVTFEDIFNNRIYRQWPAGVESEICRDKLPGFCLDYNRDKLDGLSAVRKDQLQKVCSGGGGQQLTSQWQTLYDYRHEDKDLGGRNWLTPAISQPGTSAFFGLGSNDAGLRLLFYRGMYPDSTGGLYPLATHSNTDFSGATIGQYSLDLSGPAGLKSQFWGGYIAALSDAVPLRKNFPLKAKHLAGWDWQQPFIVSENRPYLVKSFTYIVRANCIEETKAELFAIC